MSANFWRLTSLFIFSVLISPSTTQAATVTSAFYQDNDGNGQVDNIAVIFDSNVTACTYEAADWAVTTAGDIGIVSVDGLSCTTLDAILNIAVTATANITGGTTNPVIDYTNGTTLNSITFADADATNKTITATDGAAPIMVSATTGDIDANGQLDQIVVTFSEDLNGASVGIADLTVAGYVVSATSETAAGVITLTITESGTDDTDATPLLTLANNGYNDLDGNSTGIGGTLTPTDNASPVITSTSIASSNADPTLAMAGDTVTFTITYSEPSTIAIVAPSTGTNASTLTTEVAAAAAETDSLVFTVTAGDNGLVSATVSYTLTDGVGNATAIASLGAVTGTVTADTTAPTLAEVTAVSTPTNDSTPDYVFSSDEIGTIVYAGDCSSVTTAAIAGNNTVIFNALADGVHSNCTITVTDDAGNISAALAVTSFTVDTVDPTAVAISIASNNANDTAYAQTNDTITITFTTSESVNVPTATIAGEAAVVAGANANWTATLATNGDEPEGVVALSLSFTDLAGNTGTASATTDASSVTFDMTDPMVTSVSIISDNTFYLGDAPTYYATTGDTITLSFTTSEAVQIPTGTVLGQAPVFANASGDLQNWTAVVTGMATDAEGTVVFSVSIRDLADNNNLTITATTDGSSVFFDRTAPDLPTTVVDGAGDATAQFKHRRDASYTWTGEQDLDDTDVVVGSGVYQFDLTFSHPTNGTNETTTIISPVATWTPSTPEPDDTAYTLDMNITDKAGNVSATSTVYTQMYTIGIIGTVTDSDGNPVQGASLQAVARYNDTCLVGQEVCYGTTDANGEYEIITQEDRTYNVTAFRPGYYLVKSDIVVTNVDTTANWTLNRITSLRQEQTNIQLVTIVTDDNFSFNNVAFNTNIYVTSLSGEITITESSPEIITVTSLSRITEITSNNPAVNIVDNGDNTYTITSAGTVRYTTTGTGENFNEAGVVSFGTTSSFASGQSRLGVNTIPASGKSASRYSGSKLGKARSLPISYEESEKETVQANKGLPGKTLQYVNYNGYAVFAGYQPGRLPLDKVGKRMTNKVVYRGGKNLKLQTISAVSSVTPPHAENLVASNTQEVLLNMKKRFQSVPEKNQDIPVIADQFIEKKLVGFRKLRAGDEYRSSLAAKTYYKHKVNKFARTRDYTPPVSRIKIKDASSVVLLDGVMPVSLLFSPTSH